MIKKSMIIIVLFMVGLLNYSFSQVKVDLKINKPLENAEKEEVGVTYEAWHSSGDYWKGSRKLYNSELKNLDVDAYSKKMEERLFNPIKNEIKISLSEEIMTQIDSGMENLEVSLLGNESQIYTSGKYKPKAKISGNQLLIDITPKVKFKGFYNDVDDDDNKIDRRLLSGWKSKDFKMPIIDTIYSERAATSYAIYTKREKN